MEQPSKEGENNTLTGVPQAPTANPEGQGMGVGKDEAAGGEKNENSVMSFWSSSNSDSDDFNDQNKMEAADQSTRK